MNDVVASSFSSDDYKLSALAGAANAHLLLARFNVSSYLLNNDTKLAETADAELGKFLAALVPVRDAANATLRANIETVIAEAPKYRETFRSLHGSLRKHSSLPTSRMARLRLPCVRSSTSS